LAASAFAVVGLALASQPEPEPAIVGAQRPIPNRDR